MGVRSFRSVAELKGKFGLTLTPYDVFIVLVALRD